VKNGTQKLCIVSILKTGNLLAFQAGYDSHLKESNILYKYSISIVLYLRCYKFAVELFSIGLINAGF